MRMVAVFVCSVSLSLGAAHVLAAEKLHSDHVSQGAARATVKQPGIKPPVKPVVNPPKSVMPLSILECAKLGGKLTSVSLCDSKVACHTKDQHGQSHYVCVTSVISD